MGSSKKQRENNRGLPPWVQGQVSVTEKIEIYFYKFITVVPVLVTFGVYFFLMGYYGWVSSQFWLIGI